MRRSRSRLSGRSAFPSEAIGRASLDPHSRLIALRSPLAANQSGAVAVKTVVLLTPEEMDNAAKRTVNFRPAGH